MKLWPPRSNIKTVRLYVDAINSCDFAIVEELLAENFCITDSSGHHVRGRAACLEVIRKGRELAPDYRIRIDRIGRRNDDLYISGATISSNDQISGTTHFRVVADHQHVFEWQSFSEKPMKTIAYIAKSGSLADLRIA